MFRKSQRGTERFIGICAGTLLLLIAAETLTLRYWQTDAWQFQFLMVFVLICAAVFVVSAQGVWRNLE